MEIFKYLVLALVVAGNRQLLLTPNILIYSILHGYKYIYSRGIHATLVKGNYRLLAILTLNAITKYFIMRYITRKCTTPPKMRASVQSIVYINKW